MRGMAWENTKFWGGGGRVNFYPPLPLSFSHPKGLRILLRGRRRRKRQPRQHAARVVLRQVAPRTVRVRAAQPLLCGRVHREALACRRADLPREVEDRSLAAAWVPLTNHVCHVEGEGAGVLGGAAALAAAAAAVARLHALVWTVLRRREPVPAGAADRRAEQHGEVVVAVHVAVADAVCVGARHVVQVHHIPDGPRARRQQELHALVQLEISVGEGVRRRVRLREVVQRVVCVQRLRLLVESPVVLPQREEAVDVRVVHEEERLLRRPVRHHVVPDEAVRHRVRRSLAVRAEPVVVGVRRDQRGHRRLVRERRPRAVPALQARAVERGTPAERTDALREAGAAVDAKVRAPRVLAQGVREQLVA
eukprot:Rhum_TRINITY_DN3317_c0_g1::Rhum_TRINITY_DN3317_c0_g1_i1::g.10348::m.10348